MRLASSTFLAAFTTVLLSITHVVSAAVVLNSGPGWVELDNALVAVRVDLSSGTFAVTANGATIGPFETRSQLVTTSIALLGDATATWRAADSTDVLGVGKALTVAGVSGPHRLELVLVVRDSQAAITGEVVVTPGLSGTLSSFSVLAPNSAGAVLGSGLRVLSEAHQSWFVPSLADRGSANPGEGWSAVYSPTRDVTWVFGALSQRELSTVSLRDTLNITLAGPRRPVAAGVPVRSDVFSIHVGAGQNSALEAHADATARLAGVVLPTQPDWGWISWYSVVPANEGIIQTAVTALAAIDRGRNQAILLVDDSWQNNIGDWQANTTFPSGMPALAASIHTLSLKAGIWLMPFGVSEVSQVAIDHPDWLVETAPGVPQVVENLPNAGGRIFRVDPSVPGVNTHLANLIARVTVDWGFDLVKIDFMEWGLVEDSRARPGADPRTAFRAAIDAMHAAARPGTTFLLCGMPLAFAPTRGVPVRTGPDTNADPGRQLNPYRSTSRRAHQNGALYHADADVLMVRSTLDDGLARQRMTHMAMVGGPVFFGDAFWWDAPPRQALQQRLIPPHPYRGRPLDVFTSDVPALWAIDAGSIRHTAAITYGRITEEKFLPVALDTTPRLIYDVWADVALGLTVSSVVGSVASGDAALLTSVPLTTQPTVVATDTHLLGASVQVTGTSWNTPNLSLNLRGKPLSPTRVVIATPPSLTATNTSVGVLSPRSDGLFDLSVELDSQGTAAAVVAFAAVSPPPPPSTGRPAVTPPAGVQVVFEEAVRSEGDLLALLDEAARGTFIVVLPPPEAAPAPARFAPAPWVEIYHAGHTTQATAGSIAQLLAVELGLPNQDSSGALLNLRPGVEPPRLLDGAVFSRFTHIVITSGRGAILRLGRLDDSLLTTAIARLGDPAAATRVRDLLAQVGALTTEQRASLLLDGNWRFQTDPGDIGIAEGWNSINFDDTGWTTIPVPSWWETAGHSGYNGIAWYRNQIFVPQVWSGLDLLLELDAVDDEDWTSFNGVAVGDTHNWITPRRYPIAAGSFRGGESNTIAIRVRDSGASGGVFRSVRLSPSAAALEQRLSGGDLIGFIDVASLRPSSSAGRLYAVRVGDNVMLTVRGGALPLTFSRGAFPRAAGATTIGAASVVDRTIVDDGANASAAYAVNTP